MQTAIPGEVVLDASAAIRLVLKPTAMTADVSDAIDENRVEAHAPAHLDAEVANALLQYVRTSALSLADATDVLATCLATIDQRWPVDSLAELALAAAVERSLSAYDACYAVLAERLDVPLVTADRRLAAATPQSVLLR